MTRLKYVMLSGALIVALGLAAAACGDDDAETDSNASQQSVEELMRRVQRNEMMHSILKMDDLGLHAMDDGLNEDGAIESSYAPNTRTLIRLIALTDWSDELQADADALHDEAVTLLQALHDEDVEAAAQAATSVHDLEHDFSAAVWNELAADLPPDAGGPEEHGDGGMSAETPAATGEAAE